MWKSGQKTIFFTKKKLFFAILQLKISKTLDLRDFKKGTFEHFNPTLPRLRRAKGELPAIAIPRKCFPLLQNADKTSKTSINKTAPGLHTIKNLFVVLTISNFGCIFPVVILQNKQSPLFQGGKNYGNQICFNGYRRYADCRG